MSLILAAKRSEAISLVEASRSGHVNLTGKPAIETDPLPVNLTIPLTWNMLHSDAFMPTLQEEMQNCGGVKSGHGK